MRRVYRLFISVLVLLLTSQMTFSADVSVIPQPSDVQLGTGEFVLDSSTRIVHESSGVQGAAVILAGILRPSTGWAFPVVQGTNSANSIYLSLDNTKTNLGNEGCLLECTTNGVTLTAFKTAGLLFGIQTLRQLLPAEIEFDRQVYNTSWAVPCLLIEDVPRFERRGLLLDPARHFLPKEWMLKYIDLLAMYKINQFHLHLTDDQGWRIEILSRPLLTSVGAYGGWNDGYYTQDDIREMVAYAEARGVTIVPEIDMPGHTLSALAAYPENGCVGGGPYSVSTTIGVHDDVLCIGKESSFQLMEDVLLEVFELFPCPYVHIGGDEAPTTRWSSCADCQARMVAEGLGTERDLQHYFTGRMETFLNSHGRNLIGWEEILEGPLTSNAVVQCWISSAIVSTTVEAGFDCIPSPADYLYLDLYQANPATEPPAMAWASGGQLTLDEVYNYDPVPGGLTPEEEARILGPEACLWGELVPNGSHAEYMTYPRACAAAEIAWTPASQKNYADFLTRLTHHYTRLSILDVNYRRDPSATLGATDDSYKTSVDTPLNVDAPGVLQNDSDATTATLVANVQHGSLTLNVNGSFAYSPTNGFAGTDTFYYRTGSNALAKATIMVPVLGLDLHSHWEFDGDAQDSSGNNIHGTPVDGPNYQAGQIGSCINFTEIQEISLGSSDIPAPWTASMWVRKGTIAGTSAVLLDSGSSSLKLEQWDNSKKVGITKRGVADYQYSYTAPVGEWIHLVFAGTSTNTALYINGAWQESLNQSISLPMSSISSSTEGMAGQLDDVATWTRLLDADEVSSIYALGVSGETFSNEHPEHPIALVSEPANGTYVVEGHDVIFSGGATDIEDGDLSGDALIWSSSIDSVIGTGTTFTVDSLTPGEHTITLSAIDSSSLTDSDSIVVTVLNATPMGVVTTWLDSHGITNDYAGNELLDPDGDGMATWEEYYAGTDPTNMASVFRILALDIVGGSNVLYWYGTSNGANLAWSMYSSTNLLDTNAWELVVTNSIPCDPEGTGTNEWLAPHESDKPVMFYRPAVRW